MTMENIKTLGEILALVAVDKALQPTAAGLGVFGGGMKSGCQIRIGKSGSAAAAELVRSAA